MSKVESGGRNFELTNPKAHLEDQQYYVFWFLRTWCQRDLLIFAKNPEIREYGNRLLIFEIVNENRQFFQFDESQKRVLLGSQEGIFESRQISGSGSGCIF